MKFIEDEHFLVNWRKRGADGLVYRLGQDKVAKFEKGKGFFTTLSRQGQGIKHEYNVAKFLYENGVSVPRPIGIFDLKIPHKERVSLLFRRFPAFVMEYIPESRCFMDSQEQIFVKGLIQTEVKKAADLGVFLSDIQGHHNTLYVRERQKVYLVDFFRERLPMSTQYT